MRYNPNEIEARWQKYWADNKTFSALNNSQKPKYYVLDMFPYPSGAGLHVGHPLGYIASDIYARYKRHQGYNVLHPQGYDSFGLPAEQYAIQTGQHPAITTEANIKRYREQLDKIGFSFDWDREVRTSNPEYYKWTQWIFIQLFNSWYNKDRDKAESICTLIAKFEENGNSGINAVSDDNIAAFTAEDWKGYSKEEQEHLLLKYRLTYLAETEVNWCPQLGTVLANDEIVNGVSERGGYPVIRKKMTQWSMRISAYAERLLQGLETIDWTESLKESQRNWIGKSVGASVTFRVIGGEVSTDLLTEQEGHTPTIAEGLGLQSFIDDLASGVEDTSDDYTIEVFTTRPDTIFGVTFLTLAPEHDLVAKITTPEQKEAVQQYVEATAKRSERDRMADVKTISGVFTGAYAEHPFTKAPVPIWIGDYVLAGYGTGAVMAVPCGDQRDYDFAKHFNIPIKNIFENTDISEAAYGAKDDTVKLTDSDFLDGLTYKKATRAVIENLEEIGLGKGKTNYRLRDAVFSRQRYWGEPFPVYYVNGLPQMIAKEHLPVRLPEVEKYLPTEDGQPPLGNSREWAWSITENKVVSNKLIDDVSVFPLELNTMPGWAGSSWYWLRYMDPHNNEEFVSDEAEAYWQNVDLYIGGSEHATGHLLYSRFWNKFLKDRGYINSEEPFKKLINQGMILGMSAFVNEAGYTFTCTVEDVNFSGMNDTTEGAFTVFISKSIAGDYVSAEVIEKVKLKILNKIFEAKGIKTYTYLQFKIIETSIRAIHADVNFVNASDELDMDLFRSWRPEYNDAEFITEEDGTFKVSREVEKMSKSKYNVVTPDLICEQYGADTLRLYEMFLGPLEQAKPWNTAGITGVSGFLKKLWKLYFDDSGLIVTTGEASKEAFKILHRTIKKVQDDIENFSFNTSVSSFMIAVNELTAINCHERTILEPLAILISPYAPHIAEELWHRLGHSGSISQVPFPVFNPEHLVESSKEYPVSFNGKMRFKIELPMDLSIKEIEAAVLADERTQQQLNGQQPKKVIIVPGKIINLVG